MVAKVHKSSKLNPGEQKLKYLIKQAYAEFWNNVKFTRGWVKPIFTYEDVEELLDVSAHISAHIRNVVEQEPNSDLPPVLGGSTREYLWSLDKDPRDFPEKFVRDMVHQTFKDCTGYYAGVTEKRINHFIDRYLKHHPLTTQDNSEHVFERLKDQWLYTDKLLHEFFATSDSDHKLLLLPKVKSMTQTLKVIDLELEEWLGKTPHPQSSPESVSESESSDYEKSTSETTSKQEEKKPAEEEKKPAEEEKKPAEEEKKPVEEEKKPEDEKISLEIVKVSEEVDKLSSEVKTLTDHTELLKLEELSSNPEQAVKEVEGYQKQCLRYSELLMRDLLSLDQLQVGQETRPMRKKAVNHIQQLLDNIDSVSSKLRTQLQQLKGQLAKQEEEKKKEEETKRQKEEEEKKLMEAQQQQQQQQPEPEPEPEPEQRNYPVTTYGSKDVDSDEEDDEFSLQKSQEALEKKSESVQQSSNKWELIKLQPKFQVQEKRDCYLISAYVPGMNQKDIQLSLKNQGTVLTIEGIRVPSKEEEDLMIRQIRSRIPNVDAKHLDMYLLRLGVGHFGKFSENYRLSRDVDSEEISASYERGLLQVRIGKKKAAFAPNPYSTYDPLLGGFARPRQSGRQDFPLGFFNDPDMWW